MNVSIIIVTKNDPDGLFKTLFSIKNNKITYSEIIIQDGSSEINSDVKNFINQQKEQFKISYFNEQDSGIYDAMNKAHSKASSEYLWYLNGGDWIMGNPLNHLSKNLTMPVYTWSIDKGLKYTKSRLFNSHYCHQGILLHRNHPDYDTNFKICSDFNLFNELNIKFKNIKPKNGFVISELGGISSKKKNDRDRELIKILSKKVDIIKIILILYLSVKILFRKN